MSGMLRSHEDLMVKLGRRGMPATSAIRYLQRLTRPAVTTKTAQMIEVDPLYEAVKSRPVIEELVDEDTNTYMRDAQAIIAEQQAQVEQAQAEANFAMQHSQQVQQQAQQQINQLSQQVQQLQQQAQQAQQGLAQAAQSQAQMAQQMVQLEQESLSAGQVAIDARMQAHALQRAHQQLMDSILGWKSQVQQVLDSDPITQMQLAQQQQEMMARQQMMGGGAEGVPMEQGAPQEDAEGQQAQYQEAQGQEMPEGLTPEQAQMINQMAAGQEQKAASMRAVHLLLEKLSAPAARRPAATRARRTTATRTTGTKRTTATRAAGTSRRAAPAATKAAPAPASRPVPKQRVVPTRTPATSGSATTTRARRPAKRPAPVAAPNPYEGNPYAATARVPGGPGGAIPQTPPAGSAQATAAPAPQTVVGRRRARLSPAREALGVMTGYTGPSSSYLVTEKPYNPPAPPVTGRLRAPMPEPEYIMAPPVQPGFTPLQAAVLAGTAGAGGAMLARGFGGDEDEEAPATVAVPAEPAPPAGVVAVPERPEPVVGSLRAALNAKYAALNIRGAIRLVGRMRPLARRIVAKLGNRPALALGVGAGMVGTGLLTSYLAHKYRSESAHGQDYRNHPIVRQAVDRGNLPNQSRPGRFTSSPDRPRKMPEPTVGRGLRRQMSGKSFEDVFNRNVDIADRVTGKLGGFSSLRQVGGNAATAADVALALAGG